MKEFHVTYSLLYEDAEYPHSSVIIAESEKHVEAKLQKLIDENNYIKPLLKIHEIIELHGNNN